MIHFIFQNISKQTFYCIKRISAFISKMSKNGINSVSKNSHFSQDNKILIFSLMLLIAGCSTNKIIFSDRAQVNYYNDIHPIPLPNSVHRNPIDYYANVLPTKPAFKTLTISGNKQAKDINSFDNIPASSWFFPRLGYEKISPEDLVTGATEFGPPVLPITIIKGRKLDQSPRFFIKDSRNIYYLLKFDPYNYPYISTTTSLIVNRLFWGFGYHVPESHLFYFKKDDLILSPQSNFTLSQLDEIFKRIALPENGNYRSIAIRIVEGLPLGPAPEKGIRQDDPNDQFPHEERRVLRGLKIFCAFTNLCDISSENLFDIYVGEEGKGYIKHYLIDFDDAFGTHAARNQQIWAGFNHVFSLHDIIRNFFTFGFNIENWETIKETQWKSVGSFESSAFNPSKWKETHPFTPIRYSQPADDYWAAKILNALTEEHIEALVNAANYPNREARDYIIKTLLERRSKILFYFTNNVTPVEYLNISENIVKFYDMQKEFSLEKLDSGEYHVQFYNQNGKWLSNQKIQIKDSLNFEISLKTQSEKYLRIDILKFNNINSDRSVQFHFKKDESQNYRLVGIIR